MRVDGADLDRKQSIIDWPVQDPKDPEKESEGMFGLVMSTGAQGDIISSWDMLLVLLNVSEEMGRSSRVSKMYDGELSNGDDRYWDGGRLFVSSSSKLPGKWNVDLKSSGYILRGKFDNETRITEP